MTSGRRPRTRLRGDSGRGHTRVHLVVGPPCSGKTTYVRQHARPGDLIVEWDALAAALSGQPGHERRPELVGYVAEARDAVIDRLCQRRRGTEPAVAWIVTTSRTPDCLLVVDQVIVMDTPPEECLRRLHADPDGRDVARCELAIRTWHAQHLGADPWGAAPPGQGGRTAGEDIARRRN